MFEVNALLKALVLSGERITKSAFSKKNWPFGYYPVHMWGFHYALDEMIQGNGGCGVGK